ncbi:MAG: calcium-binding protein, partial [Pseudomonadota bacterium]
RITALPGGGFSMVYIDDDGLGVDIEVANFDAAGVQQSRRTVVSGDNSLPEYRDPTITAISDTQALIAYVEDNASGDDRILIRTYDPSTNTLGSVVQAFDGDSGNNGNIINLEIDVLGNGNYIIGGTVQGTGNIVYSVVSPGGIAVPGRVFGNGTTQDASFAGLPGNVFVYAEQVQNGSDSFITVLRFDTGTNTLLGFTDINPPGNQNYNEPEVVALDDGGFIVFWDDDDANTLEGQRFDSSGNTVGNQFQLTDTPDAIQIEATLLGDGRVAVSFVASPTAFASNIRQVILDTRDNANTTPVYSPDSQQIGTIGDDTFTADADEAFGREGNDTILDGLGTNEIFGGDGDDTITILSVDSGELADGGDDNDTLIVQTPGNGAVTIDLAAETISDAFDTQSILNFENATADNGDDTITGTDTANILIGGNGADTIFGGDGHDIIVAGGQDLNDGVDTVFGGEGDDTITGGFFVDDLHGDAGDDTFIIGYDQAQQLSDFIDTIDGGADTDTLDLAEVIFSEGYTVNLLNEVYEFNATGAGQQSITNVENIIGSQGNDTLTGDGEVNELTGNGGIDRLDGGAGADILTGGAGNDTLFLSRWQSILSQSLCAD